MLSILAPVWPVGAFAAEEERDPSVEVNLEVLDRFAPPKPPKKPQSPSRPQTLESYKPPPMFSAPAPKKVSKPEKIHGADTASPLLAVPAGEVITEEIFKPPVPPRRPKIMQVPESVLKKARVNYASQEKNGEQQEILGSQLVQPTARDILKSIDDHEITEPLPSLNQSNRISIGFQQNAIVLEEEMKKLIRGSVISKGSTAKNARYEIRGFASLSRSGVLAARRLSLARALEVKDFLVAQKIDPQKIDLQALGSETGETPADRVDIYVSRPANH